MFGFFKSDSRGSEQKTATPDKTTTITVQLERPTSKPDSEKAAASISASKRGWDCLDDSNRSPCAGPPAKRAKLQPESLRNDSWTGVAVGKIRDVIEHQFGLEILLKHKELRLINQELAKSQIALEQLRRCHLIPYPQSCPTPDQMLDISNGTGPALETRPGDPAPRWAPPFGVVDGPYARHYARWLIPDPSFDGLQPEWQFTEEFTRARASVVEGRTTRNSLSEPGIIGKNRPMRGMAGQKLQALSNGYPQAKDKAGPCILKRTDGQTVKLVCLDCNRENFSSTQGFINHCRIAHKRDFKSHEEAAMHSGQPIDAPEPRDPAIEDKTPAATPNSVLVHPFARQDMTEQQAYIAVRARLEESLKLYHAGKLPGVDRIPSSRRMQRISGTRSAGPEESDASSETPYLRHLMESRNFNGSLRDLVADAKTKISLDDMTPDEESDDAETPTYGFAGENAPPSRTPVVMRVPAGSGKSPAPPTSGCPAGGKGRHSGLPLVLPATGVASNKDLSSAPLSDEDVDMEDANLSPNTLISNNAPSLVSDDGEYDDSDEGSSVSGTSDNLEDTSMSDVAEISLDDEHGPRAIRRGSGGVAGPVRFQKDEAKHVTFMSPVKNTKQRRPGRV